ncbi:MAG: hypothetical protein RLZZ338_1018 [Cyanobacteriota bacterium]|jgi:serine/threonine protein kinase
MSIADILGNIHASNIIHKDINPSNIVINPSTGILKIIDVGISTQLSRENPNILEGTRERILSKNVNFCNKNKDLCYFGYCCGTMAWPNTEFIYGEKRIL